VSALSPFRNREAAYSLAVFLGQFWSSPNRLAAAFPIDRRALVGHAGLGLTEGQVRGAIRTLEAVGFPTGIFRRRAHATGSRRAGSFIESPSCLCLGRTTALPLG
jgi:hypothetical protein